MHPPWEADGLSQLKRNRVAGEESRRADATETGGIVLREEAGASAICSQPKLEH